jgi:hypothetical protein
VIAACGGLRHCIADARRRIRVRAIGRLDILPEAVVAAIRAGGVVLQRARPTSALW